jgi:metal-sulfur cluster biosynthetic enzyme
MTVTRSSVLEALQDVPEPCSIAMRNPMDITEMGLVDEVEVEVGHVRVELLLTDPACVHFTAIRRFINDVLMRLDGVETVEVALSTKKLWTPDRVHLRKAPA